MKHLLFAFVALFSFSFPAMSQPEKTIDDLFAEFDKTNSPGAAVMVIKDGKPVFAKAYGLANSFGGGVRKRSGDFAEAVLKRKKSHDGEVHET